MCVCVCVCVCVHMCTFDIQIYSAHISVCTVFPSAVSIPTPSHTHPSHTLPTDQEERQWAIREFKEGRKDVLVATDIASKGLDFDNIQHVINYDMPTDIENYGECVCVCVCVCA